MVLCCTWMVWYGLRYLATGDPRHLRRVLAARHGCVDRWPEHATERYLRSVARTGM